MPVSSRQLVRNAVGLAVVAPAAALLGLAVSLAVGGGLSGFLAGLVVAVVAFLIMGAAFVMTHAPVSIKRMLSDDEEEKGSSGGSDGEGSSRVRLEDE